jgi:hypothetical protein
VGFEQSFVKKLGLKSLAQKLALKAGPKAGRETLPIDMLPKQFLHKSPDAKT